MNKQRVLCIQYIEDNPNNMTLVERIIEAEGHQMLMAETGIEGLEIARSKNPDLIFLDLKLPDINGMDVLRQLKADPALASIPVVVISAHGNPVIEREAKTNGSAAFLHKPTRVDKVRGVVDQLLKHHQS